MPAPLLLVWGMLSRQTLRMCPRKTLQVRRHLAEWRPPVLLKELHDLEPRVFGKFLWYVCLHLFSSARWRTGNPPVGFVVQLLFRIFGAHKMLELCRLDILPSPLGGSHATRRISWFILEDILLIPWGEQRWKALNCAQSTLNNEDSVFFFTGLNERRFRVI